MTDKDRTLRWEDPDQIEGDIVCDLCQRRWRSWAWNICPHCDPDESLGNVSCLSCRRRWRTSKWNHCHHCRRRAYARECTEEWLRFKLAGMPVRSTEVH